MESVSSFTNRKSVRISGLIRTIQNSLKGLATISMREMRVMSRSRFLHLERSINILVVTALLVLPISRASGMDRMMFMTIYCSLVAWCVGALSVADSISKEKRDGTLGLLMMTSLRPYEILYGKLVSRSLSQTFGLLGLIPIFMVILIDGGVTPLDAILSICAVYINFLLACCGGLAISARVRQARHAYIGAVSFIFVGIFGQLLISQMLPVVTTIPRAFAFSPLLLGIYIQEGNFLKGIDSSNGILPNIFINADNTVSMICLLIFWFLVCAAVLYNTSIAMTRFWRKEKRGHRKRRKTNKKLQQFLDTASQPLSMTLARKIQGIGGKRPAPAENAPNERGHRLVIGPGQNPIEKFWLRKTSLPHWQLVVFGIYEATFIMLFLLVAFNVWLERYPSTGTSIYPKILPSILVLLGLVKFFDIFFRFGGGMEVCRKIIEDRSNSGMELLLTTPIPDRDLAGGISTALEKTIRRYAIITENFLLLTFWTILYVVFLRTAPHLGLVIGIMTALVMWFGNPVFKYILGCIPMFFLVLFFKQGAVGFDSEIYGLRWLIMLLAVNFYMLMGCRLEWRVMIKSGIHEAMRMTSVPGTAMRMIYQSSLAPLLVYALVLAIETLILRQATLAPVTAWFITKFLMHTALLSLNRKSLGEFRKTFQKQSLKSPQKS